MWVAFLFSWSFAWSLLWRLTLIFSLVAQIQKRFLEALPFLVTLSPSGYALLNAVVMCFLVMLSFTLCVYWMLRRGVMAKLIEQYAAFESRREKRPTWTLASFFRNRISFAVRWMQRVLGHFL